MKDITSEVEAIIKRYRAEVRDTKQGVRNLSTMGERLCAQTHANVKEACANELQRLLDTSGHKSGARR